MSLNQTGAGIGFPRQPAPAIPPAHGRIPFQIPQVDLVEHEAEALGKLLVKPAPERRAEKVEICFFTWLLPQDGQIASSTALALRISSSKDSPQLVQTNSNIGITYSVS